MTASHTNLKQSSCASTPHPATAQVGRIQNGSGFCGGAPLGSAGGGWHAALEMSGLTGLPCPNNTGQGKRGDREKHLLCTLTSVNHYQVFEDALST